MERQRKSIILDASNSFVTDTDAVRRYKDGDAIAKFTDQSAYLVKKGEVFVYVTKWKDGKNEKLCRLCSMQLGDVIPTLAYQDDDYIQWRFVIKAKAGDAELEEIPKAVTSVVRARFAQKAELTQFKVEGFEKSIIEQYKKEEVQGELYHFLVIKGEEQIPKKTTGLIKQLFDDSKNVDIQDDDSCIKAVKYACRHLKLNDIPFEEVKQSCIGNLTVQSVANAAHLLCREVILEPNWYRDDCGVIVGTIGKNYVTCVPKGFSYEIYRTDTGTREKLTKQTAEQINPKAFCIQRNLPSGALKMRDLLKFGVKELHATDVAMILLLGLVTTLIGILLPTLNEKIYDEYIPLGSKSELVQFCMVIGSFMVGNLFFSVVKGLAEFRMQNRIGYRVQDAAYHRVFRLPERFFRRIESADLAKRLMSIGGVINAFVGSAVITGISAFFAIIYLVKMFRYQSKLTWISLLMLLALVLIQTSVTLIVMRYQRSIAENTGKANSKLYQYLNGIPKIRMAGAEERAIYDYMVPYTQIQSDGIRMNQFSSVSATIAGVSSTIFSMVLYYVMVNSKISISIGAFMGFNTAFGAFSGSFSGLFDKMLGLYQMKPTIERFKPIFDTACEDTDDLQLLEKLTGALNISHLSFAYSEGSRMVLEDINLDIKAGEYIGIVGSSGCGKSTLLKILLGFETPVRGQVTYDGNDLKLINKYALRKQMGVVLQNGKLIAGSIYENITITAPKATRKDVERVIEAVGLKDDIAQMPMGLQTVLSENSGTISGGQQQRILIARAIISNPSILIFDEATSALDNITQEMVSESLDRMHVTRIVVAHRLSTIKNCDRIIVMDRGKVVEEGSYDSLMRKRGLFFDLAVRQISEGGK